MDFCTFIPSLYQKYYGLIRRVKVGRNDHVTLFINHPEQRSTRVSLFISSLYFDIIKFDKAGRKNVRPTSPPMYFRLIKASRANLDISFTVRHAHHHSRVAAVMAFVRAFRYVFVAQFLGMLVLAHVTPGGRAAASSSACGDAMITLRTAYSVCAT